MAHYVDRNLETAGVNSTRLLYWLYRAMTVVFPASFAGRVSLVDSDAGPAGNWTSETGPTNGAYIIIESAFAWDGVRWQVMIGASNAAGAIGGYAGPHTGLVIGFAPNGGWNSTTETFGAALFTNLLPTDGSGVGLGNNNGAAFMHFGIVETLLNGVVLNCAIFGLIDDTKNGSWDQGFLCGAGYYATSTVTKPAVAFIGIPQWQDWARAWGCQIATGPLTGRVLRAGGGAIHDSTIDPNVLPAGSLLTDDSGEPIGITVLFNNATTARGKGWLPGVFRTEDAMPDGTQNDAHDAIIYNGLWFPW